MNIKYKYAVWLLLLCCLSGVVFGDSTLSLIVQGGSTTISHSVSMERADNLKWPVFGSNNSGSYTYSGSQASVVTLGQTVVTRDTVIDQRKSTNYMSETTVDGDYMINAEDTAGMMNIQPNAPEIICDSEGFLTGAGDTGSYPISEALEGRTGVILHNGGTYQSEIGINDGRVHISGAGVGEEGYVYLNVLSTSKKGFDKNSTKQNVETTEHINVISRSDDSAGLASKLTHDYNSIDTAYEDVIVQKPPNVVTSISEGRLDEFVNETVNEDLLMNESISVNITPTPTPTPNIGLEELTGQSIIRDD